MALSYLFDPNTQFQNKNGVNNVFGHLEVFINDSDDHAPTYCNFTGTLNPERIVLDNNGRAVVIVDELKTYRIEVYDRSGNMLWSQYPVRPTNVIYGDYNVYNADIYGTPDEIDVDVVMSASGVKKFTIKLANAVKTVIGNIQDTISSIVETVSTKADKVQGATAGNLAALDANGNLADSGKKTADFKTKQTAVSVTGGTLKGVASMSQNANGEVTLTLNDIQDGTTVQKGVVRLNNAINSTSTTEAATPKAVKDAYDDLNNKIVARAVFLSQAEWAVQSQIPGDPAKVYYVENGTGEDAYTVYVWKDSTSEYVEVDESSIDLDGYWHDGPTTTGNGNVITDISLGNDGVPQVVKGITALTQHQSVTDNNPTLAWGTTSKVGTVGSTNLRVTMPSNPASGKADKANITGATKCRITYNSQGIVTAGANLDASDIPNLAASKITSGQFGTDRIADDAITAAKVKDNETLPVNISGRSQSVRPFIIDKGAQTANVWAKVATVTVSAWNGYAITLTAGYDGYENANSYAGEIAVGYQTASGGAYANRQFYIYRRRYSSTSTFDARLVRKGDVLELWVKDGVTDTNLHLTPVYTNRFKVNYADSDNRTKQLTDDNFTAYIADKTFYEPDIRTIVFNAGIAQTGSTSTPVYVDADGQVKPCGFQVNFGTPIAGANVLNIITA